MRILLGLLLPTIALAQAHFEYRSAVPTENLLAELSVVYNEKIKDKKVNSVYIEGHTDSRGSEAYNLKLSQQRADAAAKELVKLGADSSKIVTAGKGESSLLDLGVLEINHSKNRRIVITVDSEEGETTTVISEESKCEPKEQVRVERHKHIVSVTLNRSITGYNITRIGEKTVQVQNRYTIAPGLMYQNNVRDNLYLGVQVDLNKSVGANLGLGF